MESSEENSKSAVKIIFVNEQIANYERYHADEETEEEKDNCYLSDDDLWETTPHERKMQNRSFKISLAKEILPNDPARAAEVLSQLGSCHRIWAIQKQILKEKYGITWYTPAELNPDIKFD